MRKGVSSVARFAAALMMAVGYGTSWAAGTQTVLVNTVDELTNAVAQATKSGDYFEIVLKPGIYDLSNLTPHSVTNAGKTLLSWGTACAPDVNKESHLVFNVKLTLRGENTKHWSQKTPEEESVIKGNGTMRLLYPYTGAGRTSTFQHLSFENGHTALNGGAIYVMNTDDALNGKLTNCVFRNCSADETGGATFHLSAFDCLYENNTAPKAGAAYGGCGNSGYPTNVFNNCVFRNNTATTSGGGALFCKEFQSIQGCLFSNNVSQVTGAGALYIEKPDSTSQIENCVFLDNVATDHGGAIHASAFLGRVVGCVFSNNVGSAGGALSALGGLGLVSNNVFALNRALAGSGGAAYVKTRTDTLVDCSFVGNTAQYSGGAYVASSSGIGEIARCSFKTNSAAVSVGGLSIGIAQDRISDCVFEGNQSKGDSGALFVGGKLTTLTNCTFVGNSTTASRAALSITAYDSIVGCTFKDNVAGTDYAGVAVGSFANAGTIENCVFDNNTNKFANIGSQVHYARQVTGCTFKGFGDMFALNYDRCIFDGCAFDYDNYGGGMIVFNTTTGAGHVRNCLFTNCTAHVYIKNDTGKTVEISNCTFVDNDAIRVRNVGSTDKDNMSDGYLIYAFRGGQDPVNAGNALPSTNRIVNCIFWNNRQNGVRNDVSLYRTRTSVVNPAGNIIQNSMCGQVLSNADFFNTAVKVDLVSGNPKFLSGDVRYPESPFYMISRGSPARNTGLLLDWMTAGAVDLAGNPRIVDGLPDMGCYECDLPMTGTMLLFR